MEIWFLILLSLPDCVAKLTTSLGLSFPLLKAVIKMSDFLESFDIFV